MKIYQIGGAVRDMIRGKEPNDFDYVVVGSSVAEMQALGFHKVGKDFPVFLHPETKEEYALARKEIKTGPKHTDFSFIFDETITLEEDMQRRDFTMNALARNPLTGEISDFCGGVADIKNKIIRHVNGEHFTEDPLRILRMCRFAAQLDFDVAPETLALASQMVEAGMLAYLPKERVWGELYKALKSPKFEKFILVARECGALKKILPEVAQFWNVPERIEYHPEGNSGAHTISVLRQAAGCEAHIKFAVLLHDIGKINTPTHILPTHHAHEKHGVSVISDICRRLGAPNKYSVFAQKCCFYHMKFRVVPEMSVGKVFDMVKDVSKNLQSRQALSDFLQVCRCDKTGQEYVRTPRELEQLKRAERRCLDVFERASQIKATDMPDFAQLKKDKMFASLYRNYVITQLSDL